MRIPTSLTLIVLLFLQQSDAFSTRPPLLVRPWSSSPTSATSIHKRRPTFLCYKTTNSSSIDVDATLSTSELLSSQTRQELEELYTSSSSSSSSLSTTSTEREDQQQQQQDDDGTAMTDVNKARLLLLGAAALYGTNFSLVKIIGETGMSVGLSSTLRFGMAALATLPFLLSVEEHHKTRRWQQLFDTKSVQFCAALGGLEVGMWNSIGYVAQAVGLETTTASKSAFLCSLAVVIVPILDFLNGRKLATKQVIGAILAVVGVGILELEGAHSISDLALSSGDLASLIQPLAFGFGFWKMVRPVVGNGLYDVSA